jgi:hypothetical protein
MVHAPLSMCMTQPYVMQFRLPWTLYGGNVLARRIMNFKGQIGYFVSADLSCVLSTDRPEKRIEGLLSR